MKASLQAVEQWPDEPIHFYEPSKKQLEFHISPGKVRVFCGANQIGKTWGGVIETCWHSSLEYPQWYPAHLRFNRPTRGRILVRDFEKGFQDVLMPWLNHFMPKRCIEHVKNNSQGIPSQYKLTNGSTFSIVTCKQPSGDLEGWTGDWVYADEPFPRSHWVALRRGLRADGKFYITMTPIDEQGGSDTLWMFDDLYQKSTLHDPDSNTDFIFVDITEGFKTQQEIDEFDAILTEDEKVARMHGQFLFMTGLVYKEMADPGDILIEPFPIPDNWTRYCVCDPHDRAPVYVNYFAVSPDGIIYAYDELVLEDMTYVQMADAILSHENHRIYLRLIDPRSGVRESRTTRTTPLYEFAKHGVRFHPAPGDRIGVGHKRVKEWLRDHQFFIFNTLTETIYQFQHYSWRTRRQGSSLPEKPADKNDHCPDNTRYAAVYGIRYVAPPREPDDYSDRPTRRPEPLMTYPGHWMRA